MQVIEYCHSRETKEIFERKRLKETGNIRKYYPLSEEGEVEYLEWLRETGTTDPRFEAAMAAKAAQPKL